MARQNVTRYCFSFLPTTIYSPRESCAFSFQQRSTLTFTGFLFRPSRRSALYATRSIGQAIQEYQGPICNNIRQTNETRNQLRKWSSTAIYPESENKNTHVKEELESQKLQNAWQSTTSTSQRKGTLHN